jgi:hypothetical protein
MVYILPDCSYIYIYIYMSQVSRALMPVQMLDRCHWHLRAAYRHAKVAFNREELRQLCYIISLAA